MGDFNITALTPNNPSTKRLTDVSKTFGLELLLSFWTGVKIGVFLITITNLWIFQHFNDRFIFHLDNSCPVKTVKVKTKKDNKIWITTSIPVSRGLKTFSEMRKKFSKTTEQFTERLIKAAKAYNVSKLVVSSQNISKKYWDIIITLKNKPKNKHIKINNGGLMVSYASTVGDDFNKLFCSMECEQRPRPPYPQTLPASNLLDIVTCHRRKAQMYYSNSTHQKYQMPLI